MFKKVKGTFCNVFVVLVCCFVVSSVVSCDLLPKPAAKIAVIADPHYFDPSLLIQDGTAFQQYLLSDRKLLKESSAILDSTVSIVKNSDAEIVLVAGDLTKDGELVSHLHVAAKLAELEEAGKKVYVIPGNHDLINPHAVAFDGDSVYPVESVSPEQFKAIYKDFGYSEAIARDRHSLSYIVEPVEGLQIFALDSCKYDNNIALGAPETGGSFNSKTLCWIKGRVNKARAKGKVVFGMMHHGLLEHYQGQAVLFPEYVVDDHENVSQLFADLGMQIVFTGHYHAQDVTQKTTQLGNTVFDIETGSLLTYPCTYRFVELDETQVLTVRSGRIQTVDYPLPEGMTFQEYASAFLNEGMNILVYYMLTNGSIVVDGNPVMVDPAVAGQLTPLLVAAFSAHYAGDEVPDTTTVMIIQQLLTDPDPVKQMLGQALGGIWTDLAPADNDLVIDLTTGEVL